MVEGPGIGGEGFHPAVPKELDVASHQERAAYQESYRNPWKVGLDPAHTTTSVTCHQTEPQAEQNNITVIQTTIHELAVNIRAGYRTHHTTRIHNRWRKGSWSSNSEVNYYLVLT